MTRMAQRRQVLLLLISWLLVLVKGLNNCLQSREAYADLGLGPPEDVPVNFTIGKLQISGAPLTKDGTPLYPVL